MAFNAEGVSLVASLCEEMREVNRLRILAIMRVGEGEHGVLTTEECDAMRARLLATLAILRQAVRVEVATWPPG